MANRSALLIILDGWGIRAAEAGNAVALAATPNFDRWLRTRERAIVHSSGEHVGLTPGQMGNSEVGHLNLGAGRIVYQDISRIAKAIAEGALADNPVLRSALGALKGSGKRLHLIGLLGSGGVHSHSDHLYALLEIARQNELDPLLHLITDGRDTPTQAGLGFCASCWTVIAELGCGSRGDGQRPLLRHGPRPALGTHAASLRRHGLPPQPGKRARCLERNSTVVRQWRHRRIHPAHSHRAGRGHGNRAR